MTVSDGGMTETSGIKYKEKGIQEVHKLRNKKGEGYVDTGVKVIIAVVIGALILGGLYLLFAGSGGINEQLNNNIEGMFNHDDVIDAVQVNGDGNYLRDLQYTYNGRTWQNANVPSYDDDAKVVSFASHGNVYCAMVRDSQGVYLISSADNGVNWEQRMSWGTYVTIATVEWYENGNRFTGSYETDDYMQPILSEDGINWRVYGTPWDKVN